MVLTEAAPSIIAMHLPGRARPHSGALRPVPTDARWYYRWPWTRALMFSYCIGCACVGILGITNQPAPSITNQLGWYAVLLYSWILVGAGLIGAAGIWRNLQATVIAVWAIAAATICHGAAVISEGGLQTGLRLMVAPLMMVPLAWVWRQWLIFVLHVGRKHTGE